jgi:hypothetical protein
MRESEKALAEALGQRDFTSTTHTSQTEFPCMESLNCLIFGGDLNYRLDLTREEVDCCLNVKPGDFTGGCAYLFDHDQLTAARASRGAFDMFQEGPVFFAPTFKFDHRSATYDSSKKKRVPAWTDRVLYRAGNCASVDLVEYSSVSSIRCSDHRPVYARFLLKSSLAQEDS